MVRKRDGRGPGRAPAPGAAPTDGTADAAAGGASADGALTPDASAWTGRPGARARPIEGEREHTSHDGPVAYRATPAVRRSGPGNGVTRRTQRWHATEEAPGGAQQEEPIVGGLPDVPGIGVAMRLTPGLGVHLRGLADELLVPSLSGGDPPDATSAR